jgi:uncharacterized protein
MKKTGLWLLFVVLGSLHVLPAHSQANRGVAIGTGFPSGVYHPLGNGIADIVARHMPGYTSKVETTGGSVDNLKLVGTQRIDVGFSMADASWDAYTGLDKFKSGKLPVRALMVLYPNALHIVALDRPDITKIGDLRGKRLATGAPGSATEIMALRVLEAYGIDKDKEVHRERLGLEDSIAALKDRKVDVIFWSGGVPTAAIAELAANSAVKTRLIDHDEAAAPMAKKYGPLYARYSIPSSAYPGISRSSKVVSVWNILVVNESMKDQVAYSVVKSIVEHKAEMVKAHSAAESISLENQRRDISPIPFHPGAIRYFAERGVKLK